MPVFSLHFSLFEKAHPFHTMRDGVWWRGDPLSEHGEIFLPDTLLV
jgi:hypothetical protein